MNIVLTESEEGYVKAAQGHKSFSFCEQTLHKGLIDASCDWLQSTRKNRGQNKVLRKLRAKNQFPRLLFSSLRSISSYNPHTILKNARRGRLKNYIYFYLQKLQVGPGDASCRERHMQQKTWHVLNCWGKYDELTPVFGLQIKDPTAKFLKLYVRVVNSIHFMQNRSVSRVEIRSDKSIIFSKN